MNVQELSDQLFGVETDERNGREFLSFDQMYSDGDYIVGYLEHVDSVLYLSDLGTTGFKIRNHGMNGRESTLGAVRIPITPESAQAVADAYVGLCQRLYEELA